MTTIAACRRWLAMLALFGLLTGCAAEAPRPTPPPDAAKTQVALLQAPKRPGEVLLRGELSPASHGPYAFDGRYVVRFEQFAPENPERRLHAARRRSSRPSTAAPRRRAPGSVKLFHAARRTARRTVTLHGRLYVDVSFGDFPYAIRFTPVR